MEINLTSTEPNIKIQRTERYWTHTDHGKLLDTTLGFSSFIFGYDNAYIRERMHQVQNQVAFLNNKRTETCADNEELVKRICQAGGFSGVSWSVSGTDGVECAMGLNDVYWKIVAPNEKKIVLSFAPGYHGASYLCRALSGDEYCSDHIKVLPAPQWNSLDEREKSESVILALLAKVMARENVGAVVMESVPWTTGIKPWSNSWWRTVRELCTQHGANMIIDDVYGGCGKLGHVFSHTRYGVQPDISVLGKALTNGFSPLSAIGLAPRVTDIVQDSWVYGHTWQPNMAGVGAALGVLDVFDPEQINVIEQRLAAVAENLKQKNLIHDYVNIGLLLLVKTHRLTTPDEFLKSGLTGRNYIPDYHEFVCAPALADDEYFAELEQRFTNLLS
jgi:adenosylmethionine-8-amino-7-oxononanoate aminotransferase